MLDADELPSRNEARKVLNCQNDLPVCLVSLSGKVEERELFSTIAVRLVLLLKGKCQIRVCGEIAASEQAALKKHAISCWPSQKLLPGIDFLVGAAGYNTFHEATLTQTELFALPQKRLYDRQDKRAGKLHSYSSPNSLVSAFVKRVDAWAGNTGEPNQIEYVNGVHQAVDDIVALRME